MAYDKLKQESYQNIGGINTKASPYVTGQMQFLNIVNMDFQAPGSLSKRPGSTLYIGATVGGRVGGLFEFEQLNGSSQIVMTANTNAYSLQTGSPVAFKSGLLNNGIFAFRTFVNRLFMANGQDAFKYDGTNTTNLFLPPGNTSAFGVTAAVGGGLSGIFVASYGYLNDRGYQGPMSSGFTVSLNGITFGSLLYSGMTAPSGFGITAIQIYRSNAGLAAMFGTTAIGPTNATFTDAGLVITSLLGNFNLYLTAVPKYLEIFNNQMFYAGFSSLPSTVYWSDIGEPEGIDPTFFAEFRTNDGDRITGMRYYNGTMIVSKQRSFHRINGNDPSDFLLQEISDQYGCVSHRAMVNYENVLLFLDAKGVIEFNGANLRIISNEIEPIFRTMNVDAALENAVAVHDRFRNIVLWSFPTSGATLNNTTVVYDYLMGAWTTYSGLVPSSMTIARGNQPAKTVFFGGYTGTVSNMGASLMGDNGQAITCLIQSRFIADLGNSVEKQWRRLFLNVEPAGTTSPIAISLYKNYDAVTVSATATMYQSPFQSRIDFGISSKSFAFQAVQSSATLPLRIHGFSIDYRFQRAV